MAFFNPFRPSYVRDPYPALHRLRAEEPVHRAERIDAWIVTSYEACVEVLRDQERFSSDLGRARGRLGEQVAQQHREAVLGGGGRMVASDPPEHTRLRGIVTRAFTPRYVEGMRPFVEEEVGRLLAAATPGTPFELMSRLAEPLPSAVIAAHLGTPAEDRERVVGWAIALMRTALIVGLPAAERRAAEEARAALLDYIARFTAEGAGGGESLLARLAREQDEGRRLTADELLELTIDLALAGNDTTANMIGNGVLALGAHPDQLALLRARPELLGSAIEEVLRYDPPTQVVVRVATRNLRLGRAALAEGDTLLLMLGAANRDPAQFEDPDRFDVAREGAHRHLAFGLGVHFCLGAPLARVEGEAAFAALIARFPDLRLAPGATLPRANDWMMRSVREIPLDTGAPPA